MTKKPRHNVRHLDIRHSFELRHSVFVISLAIFALIRVIRGQNFLLVDIARRPRRGFQERVLQIFLVKRFDWYRAPDLDRFLVLRLDWDRFPDLGSGLCSFITRSVWGCGVTCGLCFSSAGHILCLLISGCFGCRLRSRFGFQCRLERIIGVLVG